MVCLLHASRLQFCWSAVSVLTPFAHDASSNWLPAVALGAAAVVFTNCWLSTAGRSNPQLQELRLDWPAWSATLLLILQALQQLVSLYCQHRYLPHGHLHIPVCHTCSADPRIFPHQHETAATATTSLLAHHTTGENRCSLICCCL
jgi:hypothetical protein